ncbi:hypothetical protein BC938DRAFT_477857 [Jimgerdemannia flammicorona]|uniref:Uncharacterized protein n=1 Tax=Jimgerdemannia flammicorona TaxID=994334 RepID=A0A433P7F0_9FUNG|nr:hypothetical protein BC938DRAFT_477857 [Jimgerdemannia flammicorona]
MGMFNASRTSFSRIKTYGSHETWYELKPFPSTALFLLRLATHPCAPGFAFLMGIGIVYFIRSRKGLGWTDGRLVWHFFLRGTLLVVVNHLMTRNMQLQSGFRSEFAFRCFHAAVGGGNSGGPRKERLDSP